MTAVVCAQGLGDALLSMIVSHHLSLCGREVTTFSSALYELRGWFPGHTILPFPPSRDVFASYQTVIAADHAMVKKNAFILRECDFDKQRTVVDNLEQACKIQLGLSHYGRENGIVPPKKLTWRAHPGRVVLHPMSADPKKNWPAKKFIKLSLLLKKEGFEPIFCVSPKERETWIDLVAEKELPLFPTVEDLAAFVYESGALIGNDSGVGHLASALKIPTLTLFARKSYAQLWRPGWGIGSVVAPPPFLLGNRLKQKYWKELLTVGRVMHAFKKLGAKALAHPTP